MTEEELKQKAEEYAKNNSDICDGCPVKCSGGGSTCAEYEGYIDGFIDGYKAGKEEYNLLLKMLRLAVNDKLGIGANDVILKATYMTELKRMAENE